MNHPIDNPPPDSSTCHFKDISDFMRTFAPEVSGRSSDSVTAELESKLASFAAGNLDEQAARDLSRELLSNENAMKTLAGLINQNA